MQFDTTPHLFFYSNIHPNSTVRRGLVLLLLAAGLNSASAQTDDSLLSNAPNAIAMVSAPFDVAQFKRPQFPQRDFDIRNFGANEGGVLKNTRSIQDAIEAAADAGGGNVLIPAGVWLTGAIHLENNVDLVVSKGAELRFSQDPHDYLPAVRSRHEETECYKYSAFIYADHKTNIGITGEGTLNGQGKPWWAWKETRKNSERLLEAMAGRNVPVQERIFDGRDGRVLRPAFFQPMNCTNVLVEGVTFLYGAFWTITPTYCNNVILRKVNIRTDGAYGHTPNGDGIDPSSSTHVLIEYCEFSTGDDCIAIKSGRDKDGRRVNIPTSKVIIRHCVGLSGHGGIVIGSETSGGINDIFASDCRFHGTDRIVRIKTGRGRGGLVERLWFRNISADTIQQEVLRINMLYTGTRLPAQKVTEATPRVRDIHFSNISCAYGRTAAVEILGLPEMPVENVTFDSISIASAKGVAFTDADSMMLTHCSLAPSSGPIFSILDCTNVSVKEVHAIAGTGPLVFADGARTDAISITNSAWNGSANEIQFGPTVRHGAVKVE